MNETSRISSFRAVHGSFPRTVNSPSYEVSPRIALSAVVLPAPLGPIRPRMRPSSTRRSIPSSATVVPNALRRPWAAIVAILAFPPAVRSGGIQLFLGETEPLNGCGDAGPFFVEKLLTLVFEQSFASAVLNEHSQSPPVLDQLLVNQLLISLEDGERVHSKFGSDIANRRQWISFLEHAF